MNVRSLAPAAPKLPARLRPAQAKTDGRHSAHFGRSNAQEPCSIADVGNLAQTSRQPNGAAAESGLRSAPLGSFRPSAETSPRVHGDG